MVSISSSVSILSGRSIAKEGEVKPLVIRRGSILIMMPVLHFRDEPGNSVLMILCVINHDIPPYLIDET